MRQDVYQGLVEVLADALSVDADEVRPDAKLMDDLGAESIDFLDIVFRIERRFAIRIPRGELFPEAIFQRDPDYVQENQVTLMGLALMKEKMSFMDFTEFEKDPKVTAIGDLFTVAAVCRFVESKLPPK